VSSGLLYLVLSKVGTGNVLKALRDTGVISFVGATGIFVLMILLTSVRWGLLLNRSIGIFKLFRLQMLGTFFNIFLPGLVGGDVVKIYFLHKMAGIGTEAVASVFMDRYFGYAALMLLGLLSYPFGFGHFAGTWITWVLPGMVLAFALGSLVVFGLEIGQKRFKALSKIYGYFRVYRSRKALILKAMGIGLMVHSLSALMVYLLAVGMGEKIPLATLLVFIPIIATLAALPVSVGGIGIREGAMILLLGTVGVEADRATALSFLWYFTMVAGGALGVTEYIRDKDYIKDAFGAEELDRD
jgi:uncharacterized membrane protein YbhN (UPF0104 family)